MAFNVKYRLDFQEVKGSPVGSNYTPVKYRIDILKDAFAGSITNLIGQQNAASLEYEKIEIYEQWIMPSKLTINIVAFTTLQFAEFVTANDDEYRVDLYRDTGSGNVLYWQGHIEPGIYDEQYDRETNFNVTITATDNLKKLNEREYTKTVQQTLAQAITTGLNNISFLSLGLIENTDLYEVTQSTGAANSPLTQTSIDNSYMRGIDENWSYFTFLENICKIFQAVIFQKDAKWHFKRIPLKNGGTYTEREFNSSGVYQSNTTGVDPVIKIKGVGTNKVLLMTVLSFLRGIKYTNIDSNSGLTTNFINDGYFKFWKSTTELSRWTTVSGATYSRSAIHIGNALSFTNSLGYIESAPFFTKEGSVFRLQFQHKQSAAGNRTIRITLENEDEGQTKQYWNGASWSSASGGFVFAANANQLNEYIQASETITATPFDGYIQAEIVANSSMDISQIALQATDNASSEEKVRYKSQTSDTKNGIISDLIELSDRGGDAFADYGRSTGSYANIIIRINFATITNATIFNIDLNDASPPFIYESPSSPGDTYENITELVALVKNNYTNNQYSVYSSLVSGSTYDLYVIANYRTGEDSSVTDYNFNYSETDPSNSLSVVSSTNNTNGSTITRFHRRLLVNDLASTYWTDGTTTGGLQDVYQEYLHRQFASPYMRQRGEMIDFTHNHSPDSIIHDEKYNNGKYFMFCGGVLNLIDGVWDCDWLEVNTTSKAFTKTIENIK